VKYISLSFKIKSLISAHSLRARDPWAQKSHALTSVSAERLKTQQKRAFFYVDDRSITMKVVLCAKMPSQISSLAKLTESVSY